MYIQFYYNPNNPLCSELILTANAKPGRIPPPVALKPIPPASPPPVAAPPIVPVAEGGGVPWGTKVGKDGGAITSKAIGNATAAPAGLCRNSNNDSPTEIYQIRMYCDHRHNTFQVFAIEFEIHIPMQDSRLQFSVSVDSPKQPNPP